MRKSVAISLLTVALLLAFAVPSSARGHHGGRGGHGSGHHRFGHHGFRGHGVVVVGPSFWWDPYWWYYPPPYYGYAPPPVVVEPPPIYIQEPGPSQSYWYYCSSARAYYPSVPTCREAWIRVLPRTQ